MSLWHSVFGKISSVVIVLLLMKQPPNQVSNMKILLQMQELAVDPYLNHIFKKWIFTTVISCSQNMMFGSCCITMVSSIWHMSWRLVTKLLWSNQATRKLFIDICGKLNTIFTTAHHHFQWHCMPPLHDILCILICHCHWFSQLDVTFIRMRKLIKLQKKWKCGTHIFYES